MTTTGPLLPTYARAELSFEKGDGVWLEATSGERYLDFGGGIAVNALGYSHPHLVKALTEQGAKLWHTSNLFRIPEGERLAQRLVDATFADVVFFTNSGAEALEGAIKMARKYQYVSGHPERTEIVTFDGAFHGRTLATIAAGGNDKYVEGFAAPVEGFHRKVIFGDIEAVKAAVGPHTAAILVEPIQGEGGIRVPEPSFLRDLRALCDEHGILLVLDEVQTGVGRTGKLFSYEASGIEPDIIAVAKGIGGGFPLGAFLATHEAAKGMTLGTHGTTYGGNPLAMAVGNAVLDVVLEPGFIERIGQLGIYAKQKLASLRDHHPRIIAEVRGEGLMLGLRIQDGVPNGDFTVAARGQHLLVIPAGENVVRLLPPLIVTEADIAEAVTRLEKTCKALEAKMDSAKQGAA